MVRHIMHDGTALASIEGYIVPRTAARLAYEVLERMEEGSKEHEDKDEEKSA